MSQTFSPNRLWKYRRLMGYKQSEIAERLQLHPSLICRWEQGIAMPNGDQLIKLCLLYRALPNELYYEKVKVFEKQLFPSQKHNSSTGP